MLTRLFLDSKIPASTTKRNSQASITIHGKFDYRQFALDWPGHRPKLAEKTMSRIEALTAILSQDPSNFLARYGLAMEYSNAGQFQPALDEFQKLLTANPDYTAGYFMAAQTLVKAGKQDEAKQMLQSGIAVAQRKRDAHSESEMQAMLDEIG